MILETIALAALLYSFILGLISLAEFLKRSFTDFTPQIHDIVMLGPRSVGKTSVLAGIAYAYNNLIPQSTVPEEWSDLKELRLGQDPVTKAKISRTIAELQETAKMVQDDDYPLEGITPPVAANISAAKYTFYLSSSDKDPNTAKTITLNFHDFPGGWMQTNLEGRKNVLQTLSRARMVVVAIDAPYLIEKNGVYQHRNSGPAILSLLDHFTFRSSLRSGA